MFSCKIVCFGLYIDKPCGILSESPDNTDTVACPLVSDFTYRFSVLLIQISGSRGNNLHEVETSDGTKFLVSMPSKFRKSVWIKRGMGHGFEKSSSYIHFTNKTR